MHRLPMTDRQGHTPGRRIQDIELLRALAVVSVVVHHAHGNLFHWPTPLFDAFFRRFELWWGVDLFFAISGFVIARDLIPRLQGCNGVAEFWRNSVQFWVRRAFRLLPSAWLWLLLMLVACRFLNESGAFGTLSANLAATLAGILQYANFRFADSFFRYEYGVSFVYWSLSLEEQFYLLLPLLIFVSRRFLPWILVGVIAAQFFVWRTPLLMVLRTDALAWGVLLALASHKAFYVCLEPTWLLRWRPLGLILAALLVLGLTRVSTEQHLWSVWRIGVIALFSAALVWLASYDRGYLTLPAPLQRLGLWLGSRSYGIYLIHIPAFFLTREIAFRLYGDSALDGTHTLLFLVLAICTIVLCSEANYRYVELPLRARGTAIARRFSTEAPPTAGDIRNEAA